MAGHLNLWSHCNLNLPNIIGIMVAPDISIFYYLVLQGYILRFSIFFFTPTLPLQKIIFFYFERCVFTLFERLLNKTTARERKSETIYTVRVTHFFPQAQPSFFIPLGSGKQVDRYPARYSESGTCCMSGISQYVIPIHTCFYIAQNCFVFMHI